MSLEALERSDLSRLPGGIFTRAFVRAYAQEVGLDPDRTIQDFIAELPPDSEAAVAHPEAMEADGEALESDRTAFATAMKLILISIPIAGFVIYYSMHRPPPVRTPAPEPPATAGSEASPAAPSTRSEAPVPAAAVPLAAAPATEPAPTGLTMEIATKSDCWVSVTVDGEQLFSDLMHAGDTRKVSAHDEISLNVGDAGAFAYVLNGKGGRPLGAPGEVVSKRISLANFKEYVSP
jgi:cytoskeletal protein RodZ